MSGICIYCIYIYIYIYCVCDLVMCLGDFNRFIGRHINGFDGAHGRYGVGQRNLEERT